MRLYHSDDWGQIYHGDVLDCLRALPAESVHCVVTSPPYYGLRDYGVEGQIGLEATPAEYVARMVDVFREVRRVLRADGTTWVNLGDSYAAQGLKPKDLMGIPWRVAFALQEGGWWLRSDIIWHKPNAMPSSVTDRPTTAHEHLFLLAKSARYYFDMDAVREPHGSMGHDGHGRRYAATYCNPSGRAIRDVWTIPSQPYPGSHFATFPPRLVETPIKAGTSERGVCPDCGAPWTRETERFRLLDGKPADNLPPIRNTDISRPSGACGIGHGRIGLSVSTVGWSPSCRCDAGNPVPAVVLDPFMGSGTTARVAWELRRRWIGIELSEESCKLTVDRVQGRAPLSAVRAEGLKQAPLLALAGGREGER